MGKFMRLFCFVLAVILTLSLCGCGNKADQSDTEKSTSYIGTWKGSDHDGESVVHYLIFDESGYWNIYMNYKSLTKAIKQLPDQLVSFKIFRRIQNSGQTGCYFEYVKNADDSLYADEFSFNEEGCLVAKGTEGVQFAYLSDYTGEPYDEIVNESRDLFDRAREEALKK